MYLKSGKKSVTKFIEKTNKPKINEFRPISQTNNSYKICMGILRTKIENHISKNKCDIL